MRLYILVLGIYFTYRTLNTRFDTGLCPDICLKNEKKKLKKKNKKILNICLINLSQVVENYENKKKTDKPQKKILKYSSDSLM